MTHELKVGDRIKDNDPRMPNRVLTITSLEAVTVEGVRRVQAKSFRGHFVWISIDRIHDDGKPRRSGFSLLPGDTP